MNDTDNDHELPKPKRRVWAWTRNLIVGLVLLLFGLWFCTPIPGIDETVELQRNTQGQLVPKDSSHLPNPTLAFHARKHQANHATVTGSSWQAVDGLFPHKSLVICNRSDHPFMKRMGESILKQLQKENNWGKVTYIPNGRTLKEGTSAHDLSLYLDLVFCQEDGVISQKMDTRVLGRLGPSLVPTSRHVNGRSPTFAALDVRTEIEQNSTMVGVESSATKYSAQADALAEQMLDVVDKHVEKVASQAIDPPVEIQEKLMAPYHPTPEFSFIDHYEAERLGSVHGLMFHNETVWVCEPPTDLGMLLTLFDDVSDELQLNGWEETQRRITSNHLHLRLRQNDRYFDVYPIQAHVRLPDGQLERMTHTICFRYHEAVSQEDKSQIVDELLADSELSIDELLALRHLGRDEQQENILELATQSSSQRPSTWLTIARWHAKQEAWDACIQDLQRAKLFAKTTPDPKDIEKQIDKLLKDYELNLDTIPAVQILDQMDITYLNDQQKTLTKSARIGQRIGFFVVHDNQASYFERCIKRSGERFEISTFAYTHHRNRMSGRSCCYTLPNHEMVPHDDDHISIRVEEVDEDHYRVRAQLVRLGDRLIK